MSKRSLTICLAVSLLTIISSPPMAISQEAPDPNGEMREIGGDNEAPRVALPPPPTRLEMDFLDFYGDLRLRDVQSADSGFREVRSANLLNGQPAAKLVFSILKALSEDPGEESSGTLTASISLSVYLSDTRRYRQLSSIPVNLPPGTPVTRERLREEAAGIIGEILVYSDQSGRAAFVLDVGTAFNLSPNGAWNIIADFLAQLLSQSSAPSIVENPPRDLPLCDLP